MRNILLCGWLLLPIGAWAYHEGPGQDRVARDDTADVLSDALAAWTEGSFGEATELYTRALEVLPKDDIDAARRIRLELNKARMESSELPTARDDLESLVDELVAEQAAGEEIDQELLADARKALASSQYYITWLMRLEGLPREEWEPEIEAARQNYRLLAEQAAGDEQLVKLHQSDLESAVRLARMELEDLQGLPLPSQ